MMELARCRVILFYVQINIQLFEGIKVEELFDLGGLAGCRISSVSIPGRSTCCDRGGTLVTSSYIG